ncbi:fimbrillin family protein [Bacteroides sp. GD17]|jgi:hypothetical protein|uniref:fimbrillin family protein n=1 Tax=Bacteroides sp. GD17 TaxID=3139826 RepID=UPI00313EA5C9
MMKKYSIYIMGIGALLLSGCSNDTLQPETDGERSPITFKASGVNVSIEEQTQTRTIGDNFPYSGEIAIVAANATAATADWSNLYMDHKHATAAAEDANGKHTVVTEGSDVYYWPFNPEEYLSFTAYSPREGGTLAIESSSRTQLRVSPNSNTTSSDPYIDLLCTPVLGRFNKTQKSVELPFSHAMAQVEINVIAIDKEGHEVNVPNPPIAVEKLTLSTKIEEGVFDLAVNEWKFDAPLAAPNEICTLIENKSIPLANKVSCLLFPSTNDTDMTENVQVNITLKDASGSVSYSYPISAFQTTGNVPVTLKRGKKTALTIKVRLKDISTGNNTITLQGNLEPWDYKGESKVTIE